MIRTSTLLTTAFAFAVTSAHAQQDTATETPPAETGTAPARAFELNIGSGYNQGFGEVSDADGTLQDEALNGTAIVVGLGYRLSPHWMLGGYGESALYRPDQGPWTHHRTFSNAFGAQAHYHFAPFDRIDPWLGLGSGLRGYWFDSEAEGDTALFGVDIARLQFGVAYRMSPRWSVNPVIGASLTEFYVKDGDRLESIGAPGPTTFLFAGVVNRFDLGGALVDRASESSSRVSRQSSNPVRF